MSGGEEKLGGNGSGIEPLVEQISDIVEVSRLHDMRHNNLMQLMVNALIGKRIVDDVERTSTRKKYGNLIVKALSLCLTRKYKRGFSLDNLCNMINFYRVFGGRIAESSWKELESVDSDSLLRVVEAERETYKLSWTHYLVLLRIRDVRERSFYEARAYAEGWDYRTLQRYYSSSFYEKMGYRKKHME